LGQRPVDCLFFDARYDALVCGQTQQLNWRTAMNWYLKVMREYVNFSGRARRQEYWMFILIYIPILVVANLIDEVLGLKFVGVLVTLVHLLPSLSVGVRRLHDIGKSGWWLLIGLIAVIGWVLAIYWAASAGDVGENAYGSDPKDGGELSVN
jgi:uncharacterized membrane protein YhaH (DUF805 family)